MLSNTNITIKCNIQSKNWKFNLIDESVFNNIMRPCVFCPILYICYQYCILIVNIIFLVYKSVYQSFIPKIFTLIQTYFLLKKYVSANKPCRKILAITYFLIKDYIKIRTFLIQIYNKIFFNMKFSLLLHWVCSCAL